MDILSYMLGKQNASGGGGTSENDVGNFFNIEPEDMGNTNSAWWMYRMPLENIANLEIVSKSGAMTAAFKDCKWTYLPKISTDKEESFVNIASTFQNCSNVKTIDISGVIGDVYRLGSAFSGCTSLELIDMRGMNIGAGATYSSMLNNVPTTCVIVVKDDTTKTWFNTIFSSYTNVKTAAEYDAE